MKSFARVNEDGTIAEASGAILDVFREGPGIYHVIFTAGHCMRFAEGVCSVTPISVGMGAVFSSTGNDTPPSGANAPDGAQSVQVSCMSIPDQTNMDCPFVIYAGY